MKKLIVLALMVTVGFGLFISKVKADTNGYPYGSPQRTIVRSTIGETATAVAVGHQATIYRVSGYATSSNMTYGIYDAATIGTAIATAVKVEGGQATQYNSVVPQGVIDFGDQGLVCYTGITVIVNNGALIIEYA